jgi:hypothetical protein
VGVETGPGAPKEGKKPMGKNLAINHISDPEPGVEARGKENKEIIPLNA